ncbi:unconventional prefoldin RPB5 interactor 1-like isoform X1 [Centruroides vittatus]|uniref:unconventional prefoldin RPB5 interactor 1-like isoform X1 n=1 Tax=Centruroides vittatus TaxID=120091 RepID=UPI00350FE0D0
MNQKDLDTLLEHQQKGLAACFQQIEQWKKFKSDYENLKNRLETLADKISYDVMVPLGPLAFMPGKLVHTNEITVLLGDNWFVDRSSKQATEIVKRRIKQCDSMLDKLAKQKEQFESWIKYTEQAHEEDLVEIREEYDPVKEKLWKEQHRKNIQAFRKQLAEEIKLAENKELHEKRKALLNVKVLTDEELQLRFKDLEIKEKENDEFANLSENSSTETAESEEEEEKEEGKEIGKRITWKDQIHAKYNVITFTHTKFEEGKQEATDDLEPKTSESGAPRIQSPSDIYKEFANIIKPNELKSILKTTKSKENTETVPLFDKTESVEIVNDKEIYPLPKQSKSVGFKNTEISKIKSNYQTAFSGEIQERETGLGETMAVSRPRVSKFKSQRMNMKK